MMQRKSSSGSTKGETMNDKHILKTTGWGDIEYFRVSGEMLEDWLNKYNKTCDKRFIMSMEDDEDEILSEWCEENVQDNNSNWQVITDEPRNIKALKSLAKALEEGRK